MKKNKLLTLAAAAMMATGAWAQTDVTSTYLTNADFSQGTLASPAITTYDYDMEKNNTTFCNLVQLDGWTAVDNSNGKAGGPIAIGSGVWVGGADFKAPATNSDGDVEGNVLGIVGCWSASAQYIQNLQSALPAGDYTIVLCVYNSKGGTNAIDKNLIGFVESGGTEHFASTKQYPVNTWKYEFITFTLAAETSGYVSLGYKATNSGSASMPHLFISGLELYNGTLDQEAYEAAKTAAREAKEAKVYWDLAVKAASDALADEAYAAVIGIEKAAVEAELAKAEPTDKDGYNAATAALNTATDALAAAAPAYNAHVAEIAYATAISVNTDAATAALNAEATAASVVAATQALKVLEYSTIKDAFPNDVTSLLGTWEAGNYGTTSGQGYIGNETYFDKWNGSAMDMSSSKAITLPAGKYAVMVAGRGVSTTTMNLSVKVGETDAVSTPFLMNGDTGKGIDTAGTTNFSEEGTYSNGNSGRGWQYRYIVFETTGEEVTIAINGHLNAGTWQSFYAPVLLCDAATYAPIAVDAAKAELQAAIEAAPAVLTANIGDGVFQMSAAGVTAYRDALAAAQAAHDEAAATIASLSDAKIALADAIKAYNALEVKVPAEGQLFNIVLTYAGWTYDNKAVTFLAGDRTDMGGYNIKYNAEANTNLAQAFTFTKVSGNNYKLSQIDADGNVRYVSTGVPHNGNTSQIRTVTDPEQALVVTIIPTNIEGVYNLFNTEANNYIGSQDAGFFTVNSHINFQIVETAKPSITINTTAAGWGTVMLPFAAELPEGVKAYTCAEVVNDVLTLTPVEGNLEANKPYIIEGAWEATLKGDAQGTALTVTEGLLTGVYETQDAPEGKYILQNQNDVVGFYQVDYAYLEEKELNKPQVKANRAYLTYEAPAGAEAVKAFFLGETTSVNAVKVAADKAAVYNLAGQRVNKAQKGIYIVNGQKVVK